MNLLCLLSGTLASLIGATSFAERPDEPFSLWPTDLTVRGTVIACPSGKPEVDITKIFLAASGGDEARTVVIHFGPLPAADSLPSVLAKAGHAGSFAAYEAGAVDPETLSSALLEATGVVLFSEGALSDPQVASLRAFAPTLKSFVQKGAVLCALGPVASHLGASRLESFPHPEINLIPDTIFADRFDDADDRQALLDILGTRPTAVGIGVPEGAAIVLTGRKIRAVGDGYATLMLAASSRQPAKVAQLRPSHPGANNPYETLADLTAWRREAIDRQLPPFPPPNPPAPKIARGTLVIVGGGGMPHGLMERFVALAGGKDAKLLYIPCTEDEIVPADSGPIRLWNKIGVASAAVFHTKDRTTANSDDSFLAPLRDATGIWFGGGRQWNLADSYYGTKAHQIMKDVLARGGVIGGSSAGASIQADYLARANPVANFDIMAPGYERGLGFITGVAIDQHFSQRGRQKDMAALVDRHPQLLGIGIDEATAIVVSGKTAEIVGNGKVFFYDRLRPVTSGPPGYTALGNGTRFDLIARRPAETGTADRR